MFPDGPVVPVDSCARAMSSEEWHKLEWSSKLKAQDKVGGVFDALY